MKLKYRLLLIGVCLAASGYALVPRQVIERVNRDGHFVYDTVRRVPLKRGLDLQGGMHLALEIDESKQAVVDKADAIQRALEVVRNRIDQFGVTEPNIQTVGSDRIIVELPGIDDPQRAQEIVQRSAFLKFQITDETNALERTAGRLDAILKERGITAPSSTDTGKAAAATKSLFAKADTAKRDSSKKDTAATSTSGPFSTKIRPAGIPGLYAVAAEDFPLFDRAVSHPAIQAAMPPGKVLRWGVDSIGAPYRTLYVLDEHPITTGTYLIDARPAQDPMNGTIVNFKLTNEGGRKFRTETARHLQDYMAIVLDDRVVTAPIINSAIGSDGMIQLGQGRNITEAQDLALVLRAGALPVPLRVVEIRTIGASLGDDAIRQGLSAGVLGLALVVLIMVVYYRFSGFLAVMGLVFYSIITLAILAAFDATLTLPGLAGFVLSIGMAVDANFLIFERIREELTGGKTIRLAIDEGFRHAWSAIIDTHVTTALTAAILYQFGTGPVRGFAVALLAGLAASLMSAIFVVRTLFHIWLSRRGETQSLSI
ncbi:MAG TPA: protein translocase subunit SecD [Gemmatimonadaceae bacterium]|nr:protein translocase subunit SecD [Gemmatimonadaceae bacterium]